GQILDYRALRTAEENLAKLHLFVVDPQKGVWPTVTVVDAEGDSPYKDILVTVQEDRSEETLNKHLRWEIDKLLCFFRGCPADGTLIKDLRLDFDELRERLNSLELHLLEIETGWFNPGPFSWWWLCLEDWWPVSPAEWG